MKTYKVELLVVDHDEIDINQIENAIEIGEPFGADVEIIVTETEEIDLGDRRKIFERTPIL